MISFITAYGRWHYSTGYKEAVALWATFLWAVFHIFNIELHIRTFFSRFSRLGEVYESSGFNPSHIASVFVINMLMRFVGMIVRLIVIIVGVVVWGIVMLGGILFFVMWTLYPFLIPFCIAFGIIGFTL